MTRREKWIKSSLPIIYKKALGKPTPFQDGMKDTPTPLTVNSQKSFFGVIPSPFSGEMSLNKHTNKAC
jgi:hypothetical protein